MLLTLSIYLLFILVMESVVHFFMTFLASLPPPTGSAATDTVPLTSTYV